MDRLFEDFFAPTSAGDGGRRQAMPSEAAQRQDFLNRA